MYLSDRVGVCVWKYLFNRFYNQHRSFCRALLVPLVWPIIFTIRRKDFVFYSSKFSRAVSFTRYLNCFQYGITIYHIGCSFNYRTGIHLIVLFLLCLDKVPLSLLFFNVTKSFCYLLYIVCSFTTAFCYTIDLISHVIIFYVFCSLFLFVRYFYFFIIILLWRCMFIEWLWWCWWYLNIFYYSCHSPQIVSLGFSFTLLFFCLVVVTFDYILFEVFFPSFLFISSSFHFHLLRLPMSMNIK